MDRDIPGYEGLYTISDGGEILSVRRKLVMKTSVQNSGYECVRLCKKGIHKTFTVHRLVMLAFREAYDKTLDIDHINGNKLDNSLNNLRLATRSQNMLYASLNKLLPSGEAHRWTKLSDVDVRNIRSQPGTHTSIAELYGVSVATISRIRNKIERVNA